MSRARILTIDSSDRGACLRWAREGVDDLDSAYRWRNRASLSLIVSEQSMSRLGIVAGSVVVVARLALCLIALKAHWLSFRAQGWQTTSADMLKSDVAFTRSRKSVSYSPRITYDYIVGGKQYIGDTVRFGDDLFASPVEPTRLVHSFSVGSNPTVFFDPADPARSVLDRNEVSGGVVSQLVVGIFLVVDGVVVWWWLFRVKR
jgi:Protein of unknown function (DUF3592)